MIAAILLVWLAGAAVVFVALLASSVKAAEADARLRQEDQEWREVMSVTIGDDEGRAA